MIIVNENFLCNIDEVNKNKTVLWKRLGGYL